MRIYRSAVVCFLALALPCLLSIAVFWKWLFVPALDSSARSNSILPVNISPSPTNSSSVPKLYHYASKSTYTVDIVIPWAGLPSGILQGEKRFLDRYNGELKYALRSWFQHAPWLGTVYIWSNGLVTLPVDFANSTAEFNRRVVVIDRCKYFGSACPITNGMLVGAKMHHIEGLSERFIACDDDVFIGRPASLKSFFDPAGRPRILQPYPTWGPFANVGIHRMYKVSTVFNKSTPMTIAPRLHICFPFTREAGYELERSFGPWFDWVLTNHARRRYSSMDPTMLQPENRNDCEEDIMGVWEAALITTNTGIPGSIVSRRGDLWEEYNPNKNSMQALYTAPALMANLNDRFSTDPKVYKTQMQLVESTLERLFPFSKVLGI